ncbi:hypothetical protein KGF56_002628 [Candida oxycetoniae]|uniref:Uncharacterized protein n=1 Tax=Candida oxycetoniae TaxID=497107 RepID=A0AAI9SXJ4_9ASCO|nr:uncharacterized protein KGF56_002628 [Candida oxycetoniae]KAI3404583.2 hypothetical protein KGF56_002628 [Candida oxycetoniae]
MTTVSAKTIQSDLDDLTSQNYSILTAIEDVQSAHVSDPRNIEKSLEHWKSVFTRLTSRYEERALREEFLRKVSSLNIDQLLNATEEGKQTLKQEITLIEQNFNTLESEKEKKLQQVKNLSATVSSLYQEFQSKQRDIKDSIDEAEKLEKEVDQLMSDDFADKEVLEFVIDADVVEDLDILPWQVNPREKVEMEDKVKRIEMDIEDTENRYIEEKRKLEILDDKVTQLQYSLEGKQPINSKLHKLTLWCKEMNQILMKLGGLEKIDLTVNNRNEYRLKLATKEKEVAASLTKNLIIDGISQGNDFISRLKQMDDDEKRILIASKIREKLCS